MFEFPTVCNDKTVTFCSYGDLLTLFAQNATYDLTSTSPSHHNRLITSRDLEFEQLLIRKIGFFFANFVLSAKSAGVFQLTACQLSHSNNRWESGLVPWGYER